MMSRPNFFVGIRLQGPRLSSAVKDIQDYVIQQDPSLKRCRMNLDKLHLTCFVATLNSEVEQSAACNVLQGFQDELTALCSTVSKELSFAEIGNFTTKVLYTPPVESETLEILCQIKETLEARFGEAGITGIPPSSEGWKPHCTILKTSYDRKNGRRLKIRSEYSVDCAKFLHRSSVSMSASLPTGEITKSETNSLLNDQTDAGASTLQAPEERGLVVQLTTIDLLSMQEVQADGYYRSYAHITF